MTCFLNNTYFWFKVNKCYNVMNNKLIENKCEKDVVYSDVTQNMRR